MRGQIEFGESIMVVIVLVFMLVIGIVFYYHVSAAQITSEINYREDVDAIVLGKRVLALPEIECPATKGGSCIDYYKLSVLSDLMKDTSIKNYYGSLFSYSTIKITPIDPMLNEVTLYSDVLAGNTTIARQFLFTTLYNPQDNSMVLAYMNITRYTVIR